MEKLEPRRLPSFLGDVIEVLPLFAALNPKCHRFCAAISPSVYLKQRLSFHVYTQVGINNGISILPHFHNQVKQ